MQPSASDTAAADVPADASARTPAAHATDATRGALLAAARAVDEHVRLRELRRFAARLAVAADAAVASAVDRQ